MIKQRQKPDTEVAPEVSGGDGEGKAGGGQEQREIGGREGPDPTRYGDWEKAGRCIDF